MQDTTSAEEQAARDAELAEKMGIGPAVAENATVDDELPAIPAPDPVPAGEVVELTEEKRRELAEVRAMRLAQIARLAWRQHNRACKRRLAKAGIGPFDGDALGPFQIRLCSCRWVDVDSNKPAPVVIAKSPSRRDLMRQLGRYEGSRISRRLRDAQLEVIEFEEAA
jgi:hypothetical protein